eukprot:1736516-Rhodomonas_salina.1
MKKKPSAERRRGYRTVKSEASVETREAARSGQPRKVAPRPRRFRVRLPAVCVARLSSAGLHSARSDLRYGSTGHCVYKRCFSTASRA